MRLGIDLGGTNIAVSALLRLGDVQKIPLATNINSAIIMLEALKDQTFFNKVKGSNPDD